MQKYFEIFRPYCMEIIYRSCNFICIHPRACNFFVDTEEMPYLLSLASRSLRFFIRGRSSEFLVRRIHHIRVVHHINELYCVLLPLYERGRVRGI